MILAEGMHGADLQARNRWYPDRRILQKTLH
jgi:hypothetical protein